MILFCHGLEGTPNGYKVRQLRALGFDVLAPEFRPLPLAGRVDLLERVSAGFAEPVLLVGSSYGGLTATLVAAVHPERFSRVVLLAPAFGFVEPPNEDPDALVARLPTTVVHGRRDTVCPIDGSWRFVRNNPLATLVEVDDDHALAASIDVIAAQLR